MSFLTTHSYIIPIVVLFLCFLIKIPISYSLFSASIVYCMFMGLDLRQCVCSVLAILTAIGIYFGMRDITGQEITGWLCVLGAAPFAACGFFKYHGMTAEQFL